MKIGIRGGHSINCKGACGLVDEYSQMQKYYNAVKTVFEKYGHTVIDCNSNGSNANAELSEGANKANKNKVDLFISLHMNSFNSQAHGTEVLISDISSGAYQYAKRLVNNFAELGFANRGIKCERLYEMNHISAPNLISEICFCDNATDISIYNKYSWEKLAHVLCNAIDENIPKEPTSLNNQNKDEKVYVVTNYLPKDKNGYLDINYVLSFFNGVKCYFKSDDKGIWIETSYITQSQAENLKSTLGSWYYATRK